MTKIEFLQGGPYPAWDEVPLNVEFAMHRHLEAKDRQAFSPPSAATYAALLREASCGLGSAVLDVFAGAPLLTPVP